MMLVLICTTCHNRLTRYAGSRMLLARAGDILTHAVALLRMTLHRAILPVLFFLSAAKEGKLKFKYCRLDRTPPTFSLNVLEPQILKNLDFSRSMLWFPRGARRSDRFGPNILVRSAEFSPSLVLTIIYTHTNHILSPREGWFSCGCSCRQCSHRSSPNEVERRQSAIRTTCRDGTASGMAVLWLLEVSAP